MESIPNFTGTQKDEISSADFLKKFRRNMTMLGQTNDDQAKIDAFQDYLGTDSPAEEWYNDANTPKLTWTAFQKAFETRFPCISAVKKTPIELERELVALRLRMDDLGKTEKYAGQVVHAHIAFAERALDLVKQAKIDSGVSSLWQVRDNLPEVIRDKVPESQTDWQSFCAAIKAIDMGVIRDGVRKHNEKIQQEAKLRAEIDALKRNTVPNANIPSTPTSAIRHQLRQTTISTPNSSSETKSANNTSSNPFIARSGGRGNLFNTPSTTANQRPPPTEEDKATLRARLAAYLIQPDTAEGRAAYLDQLRAWKREFGTQRASERTGFPLRPGGAPVGSGECYQCGFTDHRRSDCVAAGHPPVSDFERGFRALCGSILGHSSRNTTQVNMVDTEEDEFAWMNTKAGGLSGNGEGPSAS
jgi:hypothetical protein